MLLACAFWLEKRVGLLTAMFAIAAPIFRAELVVLAGPALLTELLSHRLSLQRMLLVGIPTGLIAIGRSCVALYRVVVLRCHVCAVACCGVFSR